LVANHRDFLRFGQGSVTDTALDEAEEVPVIRDQDLGDLCRDRVLDAGGLVMHAICSTPLAPDLPTNV